MDVEVMAKRDKLAAGSGKMEDGCGEAL